MLRVYRGLLYLYPARYRRQFAEEMSSVFCQARQAVRKATITTLALFLAREISGLLLGALREHGDSITGAHDWNPLRRFDMRSEFRFPRSSVVLMTVIFLGIILAVEKSHSVQLKYSANPNFMSVYSTFWEFLAVGFALACAAAVSGWLVLFVLRRSGMHRLSHLQTWPDEQ